MDDVIFEEFDIIKIDRLNRQFPLKNARKKVISEISLKVYVNELEMVSLLCLNQQQEELALGFLYNEGVINSYHDIQKISYNDALMAVTIKLKEGMTIKRQESLRSITSGCGKCYTYINPLKQSQYQKVSSENKYSVDVLLNTMDEFIVRSEIFRDVGGVHSLLFQSSDYSVFCEDIGRHNCFDKVTGVLLKEGKMELADESVIYVSGRISSEIMTKLIRLGIPVVVSKSTPTASAVKLANQYNVTLIGYARGDSAIVYSGADRIIGSQEASE